MSEGSAARLTTLHWHGVKKTFHIYITMSLNCSACSLAASCVSAAPGKTEPQNVLVFAAFPRQHWQQHPQEESVWAPVLRPLRPSRPLGVARAHHSTNGAAGLRWMKNSPVTIWRSSISSTHSGGLPENRPFCLLFTSLQKDPAGCWDLCLC